ncbi:MAG: MotA/TolQ/ExbB proton channel family protein [Phycisphaerales bacterium]
MQPFLATAPAAAPADLSTVATVWDLTLKGGPVMIPIAITSLIGLAIVIERLVSLRRSAIVPPSFMPGLRDALQQGPERALAYCRANPNPVARVAESALKHWRGSSDDVARRIEEAGLREAAQLRRNLRGLSVVTAVAPLLGLLGTITGMIKAFRTVAASAEALGRTELLASGIYEAMVTTAAGLIVAIPALLAYHWLAARADRLVLDIDGTCEGLLEERDAAPVARSVPHARSDAAVDLNPVALGAA